MLCILVKIVYFYFKQMIMAKYKYPWIYIQELSSSFLPQSKDDTAVFIGYTEMHENQEGQNLNLIPTLVDSVKSFETFFGKAQLEENIEITDLSDAANEAISVGFNGSSSLHNLYYAIQIFFEQGGRSCKIVSVGSFKNVGEPLSVIELLAGLDALETEDNNLLIAIPENQNLPETDFYILQEKILLFCKAHRSFAILDLPKTSADDYNAIISSYREALISPYLSFGATFFPNLVTDFTYLYQESAVKIKTSDETRSLLSVKESDEFLYKKYTDCLQQFFVNLPPSSAIAGASNINDMDRGIWRPLANFKVEGIKQPEIIINDRQQEPLNIHPSGKAINCMRKFEERGTLIWGNRTLGGTDPEYRYIAIRRFVNRIEYTVANLLKEEIFSNNLPQTWARVKSKTEYYFYGLWNSGAFCGPKPELAYFVKCGLNETMTQQDIDSGNLIIEIGIAITRPLEFRILRFTQKISV